MKTKLYVCTLTAAMLAGFAGWSTSNGWSKMQAVKAASSSTYSMASLSGNYGYALQGQSGGASLVGLGLLVADGNGGLTGTETLQADGIGVQTNIFQGTYTIDSKGTGDMVINYPAPQPDPNNPDAPLPPAVTATYHFVIVGGQAQIMGIRSDNGVIATAQFRLQ